MSLRRPLNAHVPLQGAPIKRGKVQQRKPSPLTGRQIAIAASLATGVSVTAIADEFGLSMGKALRAIREVKAKLKRSK